MQTDKNGMKVEKNVRMHSHASEQPCKRQIVTDTKSYRITYLSLKNDIVRLTSYQKNVVKFSHEILSVLFNHKVTQDVSKVSASEF